MNFLRKFNQLSGKMRLSIFLSGIWFLWCFGEFVEKRKIMLGLVAGVFPLFIFWGAWWVKQGYKKDKETDLISRDA